MKNRHQRKERHRCNSRWHSLYHNEPGWLALRDTSAWGVGNQDFASI